MKNKTLKKVKEMYGIVANVPTRVDVEMSVQISKTTEGGIRKYDSLLLYLNDFSKEEENETIVAMNIEQAKFFVKTLKKTIKKMEELREIKKEIEEAVS